MCGWSTNDQRSNMIKNLESSHVSFQYWVGWSSQTIKRPPTAPKLAFPLPFGKLKVCYSIDGLLSLVIYTLKIKIVHGKRFNLPYKIIQTWGSSACSNPFVNGWKLMASWFPARGLWLLEPRQQQLMNRIRRSADVWIEIVLWVVALHPGFLPSLC